MELEKKYILDILKGIDIFSDLDFSVLNRLSRFGTERIFTEGETIFKIDNVGTSMMVIVSGIVGIVHCADIQEDEKKIILERGSVFGEMSLLDDMTRSATAMARSNVIIIEIERNCFLNFIEEEPEAGLKILLKLARILSSRLRETDGKLKSFASLL